MAAVVDGLVAAGAEVLDLGLCGTEEMYFATTHFDADGGIEVTASHNPMDYNGMKLVRRGSAPLDAATGLAAIKALAEQDNPPVDDARWPRHAPPKARAPPMSSACCPSSMCPSFRR